MKVKEVVLATRSNSKLNPKVSAYDYLKKWKDDPDVYISFTHIDKVGINPQSKYNTPIGIYTYPLKTAWFEYNIGRDQSLEGIPFAGNAPHIWVVRAKTGKTFIEDMHTDYGSDKFDKDAVILEQIYMGHWVKEKAKQLEKFRGASPKAIRDWKTIFTKNVNAKWKYLFFEAITTARIKNPCSSFWNLSRLLAGELTLFDESIHTNGAVKWNWLLRKCGYTGFADKTGKGIIHPSEPIQAVFLTKDAFTVIGECYNKTYKNTDKRLPISDMIDFVRALGTVDQRYDNEEYEYDKALLQWLVSAENQSIPISKIPGLVVKNTPPELWKSANKNCLQMLITHCAQKQVSAGSDLKDRQWWKRMDRAILACWAKTGKSAYN
jgi:hypothetical protein